LAKKTIKDFMEIKQKGEKVFSLTAYDSQLARVEERA